MGLLGVSAVDLTLNGHFKREMMIIHWVWGSASIRKFKFLEKIAMLPF